MISNLHTSIILGISGLSSKLGKQVLNFNENWYLEDFRPQEYDSDKCDIKMAAIAAIMVAMLAVIFNRVAKTHTKKFEVPQCSNYKEHLYLGVFRGMWSWPIRFQNGGHFGSHI